jgi:hypothetical protein
MNTLWDYFWPILSAGLLSGVIAGVIAFRVPRGHSKEELEGKDAILAIWRRRRILSLAAGLVASLAATALWHGPLGAADRLATRIERDAEVTLIHYEMTQVTARLHRGPLTRRLILTGPADDFQRDQLALTIETLPGVGSARWAPASAGMPLILEGAAAALLGFLFGLLLAYLAELHRRYNAQWNW